MLKELKIDYINFKNLTKLKDYLLSTLGQKLEKIILKNGDEIRLEVDDYTGVIYLPKEDKKLVGLLENQEKLELVDLSEFNMEHVERLDFFLSNTKNLANFSLRDKKMPSLKSMNYMFVDSGLSHAEFFNISAENSKEAKGATLLIVQ